MAIAQEQLETIFFPYSARTRQQQRERKLVHYTSAPAAVSILRGKEVWLRNAVCMNDVSEVSHGLQCLALAYKGLQGQLLKQCLDELHPGFTADFEPYFDGLQQSMKLQTYLTCLSVHEEHENQLGRLSMWRAYGKVAGVAFVLNNDVFYSKTDALGVFSSPVGYFNELQFESVFGELVDGVRNNLQALADVPSDVLKQYLFISFLFSGLCTKHPGYKEEAEVRVLHCPKFFPSPHVRQEVELVNGQPQLVYKLALQDHEELGIQGLSIPRLLDHIIIGPTAADPWATYEAFVALLDAAGVDNPDSRVRLSRIPLRRQST